MKKRIAEILIFTVISLIFVAGCIFNNREIVNDQIKDNATIDLDSEITLDLFYDEAVPYHARFLTDVSSIDTSLPATYKLAINCDYVTKFVLLEITDLTAPKAYIVPQTYLIGTEFPSADECVTDIIDKSKVTVEYENVPEFNEAQTTELSVALTDEFGNEASYSVPFKILKDTTPPEITYENLTCKLGDKQGFISLISVTDDYDLNPVLEIDDSNVNYDVAGSYPVILSASDRFGNTSDDIYETLIILDESDSTSANAYSYESVLAAAKQICNEIITDDMSDVDKARAILNWCHSNIKYKHKGPNNSVIDAAGFGFKYRQGDCYIFCSCVSFLLDMYDIPNITVCRYPVKRTDHYWNLVYLEDQWWHCDSTPTSGHPTIYFMLTDEQLDSHHEFQHDAYPERATEISPYSLGGIKIK